MAGLRISSFLCTYDDPEYLDASLTAFKDVPDKLYIIEGSWQSGHGFAGTKKRSGIETYNIIDRHVDNKRVFLVQANEKDETSQRQVGMEKAQEDGAEFCWMLDSDEVYTAPVIAALRATLMKAPKENFVFRLRAYNFINSFKRWYDGNYTRIFRVKPDAAFFKSNEVAYENTPQAKIQNVSDRLRFHHYNYVKQDPVQFHRKLHYCGVEDPYFAARGKQQYKCDGKLYTVPQSVKIFDYTGRHPAIMRNHPNIVNNIYGDDELSFTAH